MTPPLAARLSRALVGCHPRRWRQRYAGELLEVPDQHRPTARTVLKLAASARGRGDVDGLLLDDGPDPRAGPLVAEDWGSPSGRGADLVAHDAGINGSAATAEEAAIQAVDDDDYDIRCGD